MFGKDHAGYHLGTGGAKMDKSIEEAAMQGRNEATEMERIGWISELSGR